MKNFKNYLNNLLVVVFLFLTSSNVLAADETIEMLNKQGKESMVYSKKIVKVNVGDTVFWKATTKGHNVEMIASPNDIKLKSENGKAAKITLEEPGLYLYWCTPHKGMGMIGIVGGDTSNSYTVANAKVRGKSKKKLKKLLGEL